MAIKRYFSNKDNTITDAFRSDLVTRGTGSNMGASDILEVFSIYGQANSSSVEKTRFLIEFPMSGIEADRTANVIPAAGNVEFYLKLYNAKHPFTLPSQYDLNILAISSSWQEGVGLDMEEYRDLTYDQLGCNWIKRSGSTSWTSEGGDFHASPIFSASFPVGNEDLEVDVTSLVEEWLLGSKENYGFAIKLPDALETGQLSYYTKKFFGRGTSDFFRRPVLEARWDSTIKDDRGHFYTSSSLAPAADNLNTIYLYNFVRGRLTNIPSIDTGSIYVNLYSSLGGSPLTQCIDTPATGGWVSTGIYSASVCIETTASTLFDVWSSGSIQYHTGNISTDSFGASNYSTTNRYVLSVTNMQEEYYPEQSARFRFFAREKGWSPNIFTVAQSTVPNLVFESASYQITRVVDDYIVVDYGTGSTNHTLLSYDVSGNYFDLDMSMLEEGYMYGIHISIYDDAIKSYVEQPVEFKFKVNKYEY
tara:strand:+ start:25430 stop:26857 length:1428 start_codon:yes stop_codon:yes gene_type:complete